MKKTTSKVKITLTPQSEPVGTITATPVNNVTKVPKIGKLELFGNEDMHKVVDKINEIIDAL